MVERVCRPSSLFRSQAGKEFMSLFTKKLQRRGVLGGAAALVVAPAALASMLTSVPLSGELRFKILRNGTPIGEQLVTFTQNGSALQVDTSSEMLVRVLGVPVFRYQAQVREEWVEGTFRHMQSRVLHNGDQFSVAAHQISGGYAIESSKVGDYTYTGAQQLLPLTYWNKQMLNAMLLNTETGRHYPATATSAGWDSVPTAQGGKISAQRFNLTDHLHLSIWYDQQDEWSGLSFDVAGHEVFERYVG